VSSELGQLRQKFFVFRLALAISLHQMSCQVQSSGQNLQNRTTETTIFVRSSSALVPTRPFMFIVSIL
jgi:hypothetical protein